MRIVFISGVKFGHELLTTILEHGWNISAVFSYHDSKASSYSDFISFDDLTNKYNIKHVKVQNINDEENIKLLKHIKPDVILVMGWSQILKKEILEIPKLGVIGSHPTELPKYRGRAPIPWSIIKGLKESALTFFYMQEGIDDGDIIDQQKFEITDQDDATTLYNKIIVLGKKMILNDLELLENGKVNRIKQDPSRFIEYWSKRTPEDGRINWSEPCRKIQILIRATTHPYPGAFSFFKNHKLKIWKSVCIEQKSNGIGKIIDVNSDGVKVGTGDGVILLQLVSLDECEEANATEVISKNDIDLSLE